MPFIKVQKLVREGDKVLSGSAAVVDTSYVTGQKYHSKHTVRERLGKILDLSNDKRSGIFQSPTRGLKADRLSNAGSAASTHSKWTAEAVRGKILLDIINTIIVLQLRKVIDKQGYSVPEIFGRVQSLMCFSDGKNLTIETPNKKTKEFYGVFNFPIPSHLPLADARNLIAV